MAASSTLITVAPTGAEADKAAAPALPVTLAELVVTAKECEAAGAAVIHVHIRDDAARPTLDVGRLTDTVAALREGTGLIVQLSTGLLSSASSCSTTRRTFSADDTRPDVSPISRFAIVSSTI